MANQINLPENVELASNVLQNHLEQQKIEQGWLGKIWGSSASVPNNIAALSTLILIFTGIIYTIFGLVSENLSLPIKDFWSLITPLITLCVGYLFGHRTAKED